MIIRPEVPADIPAIHHLHKAAFGQSAEAQLVGALRANGKALVSLVAVEDGGVVGHILFSPVSIETIPAGMIAAGLAPLAVLPSFQRRGIGAELARAGLQACRDAGIGLVVVLGNHRYYHRFGFTRACDAGLENEYGADDHFMALPLQEDILQGVNGLVRYSVEFSETGC